MKMSLVCLALPALLLTICSAFTPHSSGDVVPDPYTVTENPAGGAYLVFAGKNGGEITRHELHAQKELKVDGCARGSRIFSYSLEVHSNGKTQTLQAKSNMLTDEMVSTLASLKPGASFEFKSLKAYLPNGKDVVDVHARKFVVV